MKNLLILAIFLITLTPFSGRAESLDLELSDEDQMVTDTLVEAPASGCLEDYRKWRNHTAAASGLTPFVGVAGLAGAGMLAIGWEYGGWIALKSALGTVGTQVVGAAVNFAIPTVVFAGTVTYETIMISRFVKASKSYRLVEGLYSNKETHLLKQLLKRIQRKRPDVTMEQIKAELLGADTRGELCDGSWVTTHRVMAGKLFKRLATLKDMEKRFIHL